MGRVRMGLPDLEIRGKATFTPPPLTEADLEEMQQRAEAVADPQIKTDLFRLISVLRAARTTP